MKKKKINIFYWSLLITLFIEGLVVYGSVFFHVMITIALLGWLILFPYLKVFGDDEEDEDEDEDIDVELREKEFVIHIKMDTSKVFEGYEQKCKADVEYTEDGFVVRINPNTTETVEDI